MGNTAGRSDRSGITLRQAAAMFADEAAAERWFEEWRWPGGVRCVACGSSDVVRQPRKPRVQPLRCRAVRDGRQCNKRFSVKTDTFMHGSKLPLAKWGVAIYLMVTGLKGVSSMKLHRDLGVTQKTAWHMAHRIRESDAYRRGRFARKFNLDAVRLGGHESGKTMLKRGRDGTFHHLSEELLPRYAGEFEGRQSERPLDTEEQMGNVVAGGAGRRLPFAKLAEKGRRRRSKRG